VDVHRLADWLQECGVDTVAMESTGVYWLDQRNSSHFLRIIQDVVTRLNGIAAIPCLQEP
jgi:hypothetical protein